MTRSDEAGIMTDQERAYIKTIDQRVLGFIDSDSLILKNDRVLLGLSGGADSVFVLHFLNKYKRRFRLTIGAAHINHGLRGSASDEDEKFCEKLCEELQISFYSIRPDLRSYCTEHGVSTEEGGRMLRYSFFETISSEHSYNRIVTAHNLNDNTETVLLNLVKGTGIKGISGIPPVRGNIVRPVLCLKKEEIIRYLNILSVTFRTDESNSSDVYQRNYIRNRIVPGIREVLNPSFEENIFRSSAVFRNLRSVLDEYTNRAIEESVTISGKSISIDLSKLKTYPSGLYGEVFSAVIRNGFGMEFKYTDADKLTGLIDNQPGRRAVLHGGIRAYKSAGNMIIERLNAEAGESVFRTGVPAKTGEIKEVEGRRISIDTVSVDPGQEFPPKSAVHGGAFEMISGDGLSDDFVIRYPRPGDSFVPLGMKGEKKISDFLSEQKIPIALREKQILLLHGENIIWVAGLRIDDRVKIKKNTKRILKLCLL